MKYLTHYLNKNKLRLYSTLTYSPNEVFNLSSKKNVHKYVFIKVNIKTGVALTSQSNLNAVLGPYGINLVNLQKKLEEKLNLFNINIVLPLIIKVYDFDKYSVIIKLPNLTNLIKAMSPLNEKYPVLSNYAILELTQIYDLNFNFKSISQESLFKTIIGSLKSKKMAIFSNYSFNSKNTHVI